MIYKVVEETMFLVPRDVQMLKAPCLYIVRYILMFGGGLIISLQSF